jgi:hypothetical protein
MGRPSIGERAMTAAERMRRYRARRAALRKSEKASRNGAAPAAPGNEAPLATVQWAWERATEAERAEIHAWIDSIAPSLRNGALLRDEPPATAPQPPPIRDLLDATSAHTRRLLAPIITGLKAEGRKGAGMNRRTLGRFADQLETILQPGLREHFARMIELLHQQSRPEAQALPRTVHEIADTLEHALADHRYELPPHLRPQQPAAV